MSLKETLRKKQYTTSETQFLADTAEGRHDALGRFWCAARLDTVDECMTVLELRMKDLFSDNRVHDSAEAMRCLGLLRQLQEEYAKLLGASYCGEPGKSGDPEVPDSSLG